jgi:hypothetical protein
MFGHGESIQLQVRNPSSPEPKFRKAEGKASASFLKERREKLPFRRGGSEAAASIDQCVIARKKTAITLQLAGLGAALVGVSGDHDGRCPPFHQPRRLLAARGLAKSAQASLVKGKKYAIAKIGNEVFLQKPIFHLAQTKTGGHPKATAGSSISLTRKT